MQIGRKNYPLKKNTAYCFGKADYNFTLSFEAESPKNFQDFMMELRESEASSYPELDTPIFTSVAAPCRKFCKLWDNWRSRYRIAPSDSGILPVNAPTVAGRIHLASRLLP